MSILAPFEKVPFKPLEEIEIVKYLKKLDKEGNIDKGIIGIDATLLAFQFLDNYSDEVSEWGGHYQPSNFINVNGKYEPTPSPSDITVATLDYWHSQINAVSHPVIKARYTGLLYDFTYLVSGKKVSPTIVKQYANALADTIDQRLYKQTKFGIKKLGKALEIALFYNDSELQERIKKLSFELELTIPIQEQHTYNGFTFDLFIDTKKKIINLQEEGAIIDKLEQRLEYLKTIDPWATNGVAIRLAQYYNQKGIQKEVKRVISQLGYSYQLKAKSEVPIQAAGQLDELLHIYRKYQMNTEAAEVLIQIRELGKHTKDELRSIVSETTVDKTEINKFVEQVLKGSHENIFIRIILTHLPDLETSKKDLQKAAIDHPLPYLVTNILIDGKGRNTAEIGPIKEDFKGHLAKYSSLLLNSQSFILHFVIEGGISKGILTTETTIEFLNRSCIIEKERFDIIERGLKAFFDNDYLVFIHLMIPQFEESLRNLLEMNGGNILIDKSKAYQLKTFHQVLEDKIVEDAFGESNIHYFKVLFTDSRGWNLRNRVAHGMYEPELFNQQTAERLFHAILCLGMMRLIEKTS